MGLTVAILLVYMYVCAYVQTAFMTLGMCVITSLVDGAVQDPATIHQQSLDEQFGKEKSKEQMQKGDMEEPNFEGTEWDLIIAGVVVDEQTGHNSDSQELCDNIDSVANTLKAIGLSSGVSKFMARFDSSKVATQACIGISPIWMGDGYNYNYTWWSTTA